MLLTSTRGRALLSCSVSYSSLYQFCCWSSCDERKRTSCDMSVCGRHPIFDDVDARKSRLVSSPSVWPPPSVQPGVTTARLCCWLHLRILRTKSAIRGRRLASYARRQIIIHSSLVSYKLTNNDRSPPSSFCTGRTRVALNSGNYRAGTLSSMSRLDVRAELSTITSPWAPMVSGGVRFG